MSLALRLSVSINFTIRESYLAKETWSSASNVKLNLMLLVLCSVTSHSKFKFGGVSSLVVGGSYTGDSKTHDGSSDHSNL